MCEAAKGPSGSSSLPAESPAVIAHLNMLQGIVTRLAGNSAECKTWCLTLVTALIAFAGATHNVGPILFAIVPVVMFLVLDVTYLAQEKAYRDLFNGIVAHVRSGSYAGGVLFAAGASFTWRHWLAALKSWSVTPFYGPLILAYAVIVRSDTLLAALVEGK